MKKKGNLLTVSRDILKEELTVIIKDSMITLLIYELNKVKSVLKSAFKLMFEDIKLDDNIINDSLNNALNNVEIDEIVVDDEEDEELSNEEKLSNEENESNINNDAMEEKEKEQMKKTISLITFLILLIKEPLI